MERKGGLGKSVASHETGRSDITSDIKKAYDKIRKKLDQNLEREDGLRRLESLQRQNYEDTAGQ